MGKNGYAKCIEIMKEVRKEAKTEVYIKELLKVVRIKVGADYRTTQKYLYLLREFEFIKPRGEGMFDIIEKKEVTELY